MIIAKTPKIKNAIKTVFVGFACRITNGIQEKSNILESIGDAFFALNKNWVVTYWNKEAEKILGRKREEVLAKSLWESYSDAIDTDFFRQYHIAMETGETVSFEAYYPTYKDELFFLLKFLLELHQ